MVTPIFFQLATLDRSSIEAARDLGASPFKVFREVILPLSLPGVLIGAIFVFVLCMGEFATVQIIGGNQVQSVGTDRPPVLHQRRLPGRRGRRHDPRARR